jgi:hypothetical protein
VATTSDE